MSNDFSGIHRINITEYRNWNGGIVVFRMHIIENFPKHWHDHYELEYIASGKGYHIINGTKHQIKPGNLHLITPTDFHEIVATEPIDVIKINYQEHDVDPFILNTLAGLSNNKNLHFENEERELFYSLFLMTMQNSCYLTESVYHLSSARKMLECILLNTIKHLTQKHVSHATLTGAKDIDFQHILAYINKNFTQKINLNMVAEYSHFSPNYLSKLFHRNMGVTFKEYITQQRMNYASKMLLNTSASITDICYEAGFGTLSNFTKEFKRLYSISPSEYRAENKSHKSKNDS